MKNKIKFSTKFPVGLPKWLFGRGFDDLDWYEIGEIRDVWSPSQIANVRKYLEFKTAILKTAVVKNYSKGSLVFSCGVHRGNLHLNTVKQRNILGPDLSFCIERDTDKEKVYFIGRPVINDQMRITVNRLDVMKGSHGIHRGRFDFSVGLSTHIVNSLGDEMTIYGFFKWARLSYCSD